MRKASIASFPEEQNFQLVDQKEEAQEEPYDTGNNDDEMELTTSADETKYSVVKAEIIPAESRIGFVEENEAENLSSESASCDYKGEIDEEYGIDAEDSKPSSASSLRLQALKGELHVYQDSKMENGSSGEIINGNKYSESAFLELNNNVIDVISDGQSVTPIMSIVDNEMNNGDLTPEPDDKNKQVINEKPLKENELKDVVESEHGQDTERNKSTASIDSSLRDKDIAQSVKSETDSSNHPQKPRSLPSKLIKHDTVVNSNDSMEVEFDSNDLDNAKHKLDMEYSEIEKNSTKTINKSVGNNHVDPMYGTLAPMGAFGDQVKATEESAEIDYSDNDNDDTTETTGTDNEDEENINNADTNRNDSPEPVSNPNSAPPTRPHSGAKSSLSVRSNVNSRPQSRARSNLSVNSNDNSRPPSSKRASETITREGSPVPDSKSEENTASRKSSRRSSKVDSQRNNGVNDATTDSTHSNNSRRSSKAISRKNSETSGHTLKNSATASLQEEGKDENDGGARSVSRSSDNFQENIKLIEEADTGNSTPRVLSERKSKSGSTRPTSPDSKENGEEADPEETDKSLISRSASAAKSVLGIPSRKSSVSQREDESENQEDNAEKKSIASRKSSIRSMVTSAEESTHRSLSKQSVSSNHQNDPQADVSDENNDPVSRKSSAKSREESNEQTAEEKMSENEAEDNEDKMASRTSRVTSAAESILAISDTSKEEKTNEDTKLDADSDLHENDSKHGDEGDIHETKSEDGTVATAAAGAAAAASGTAIMSAMVYKKGNTFTFCIS